MSTAVIAATVSALAAVHGPGAIILGGGLALSSTAVAMQVRALLAPARERCRAAAGLKQAACQWLCCINDTACSFTCSWWLCQLREIGKTWSSS